MFYHLLVSVAVGLVFGVLIDLDHDWKPRENLRCAGSLKIEDCLHAGNRGIFHDLRLWGLGVCGIWVWTIHLIMDKIIY